MKFSPLRGTLWALAPGIALVGQAHADSSISYTYDDRVSKPRAPRPAVLPKLASPPPNGTLLASGAPRLSNPPVPRYTSTTIRAGKPASKSVLADITLYPLNTLHQKDLSMTLHRTRIGLFVLSLWSTSGWQLKYRPITNEVVGKNASIQSIGYLS